MANTSPALSTIPNSSVIPGKPLQIRISPFDPDPGDVNNLSYNFTLVDGSPLPSWLTFNSTLFVLEGTPAAGDIGNIKVRATITDPGGLSATQDFKINVQKESVTNLAFGTPVTGTVSGDELLSGFYGGDLYYDDYALPELKDFQNVTIDLKSTTFKEPSTGSIGQIILYNADTGEPFSEVVTNAFRQNTASLSFSKVPGVNYRIRIARRIPADETTPPSYELSITDRGQSNVLGVAENKVFATNDSGQPFLVGRSNISTDRGLRDVVQSTDGTIYALDSKVFAPDLYTNRLNKFAFNTKKREDLRFGPGSADEILSFVDLKDSSGNLVTGIEAIEFGDGGKLYGLNDRTLYTIDPSTGIVTTVSSLPENLKTLDAVYDSANNRLLIAHENPSVVNNTPNGPTYGRVELWQIPLSGTSNPTKIGDIGDRSLMFSGMSLVEGELVGHVASGRVKIDPTTGKGTLIGTSGFSPSGATAIVASSPLTTTNNTSEPTIDPTVTTTGLTPTPEQTIDPAVIKTDNTTEPTIDPAVTSTGGTTPEPLGTQRITQAPDGSNSDGMSGGTAISNDGRYVVYRSQASNLVANDPNGGGTSGQDIFLYDRNTNSNTRIAEGYSPDISGDGRYIIHDDKILDRDTNTTTTFIKGMNGATPTSPFGSIGGNATISDDGRYIAYYSHATNLVEGDTNNNSDIFLYDRQTDATIKVSSGSGFSTVPQISGDGNFIAYGVDEESVYLYDRVAGTNTKISPDDLGKANIQRPHISTDNRYITFTSGTKTLQYDRDLKTIDTGNPDLVGDFAAVTSGDGNYQVRPVLDKDSPIANDNNGFADLFLSLTNIATNMAGNPTGGGGTNGASDGGHTFIPGVSVANNLFQTDASFKGFGITPISQKPSQKVSEIGLFAVDDLSGKIGNLSPGETGYLDAVLKAAKPIFSTLGGSFFSTDKQEINLDPGKIYQAMEIVDGSFFDAQQQLDAGETPNNILFSLPDGSGKSPMKITNSTDGYNLSINDDELVLGIKKLDGESAQTPIGAKSQFAPEGQTIDLSDYAGQMLKADMTTKSSADYNNHVGFYAVEDAIGTIKLANGSTLKPGDANYAVEAIKLAMANPLQAGKTDSLTGKELAGGKIYAPVVVAKGSMSDFLYWNPTNGGGADTIHAYFNYAGANTDQLDHFRSLGNNTFAVEDMYGGGDRDFNDLVVKMDISV
jgi:hypothetical protein